MVTQWALPGATECLGTDAFLGVPAPVRTKPGRGQNPYWSVPLTEPGVLCGVDAVAGLAVYGREAVAREEAEGDG
ncbi:hypothetical protein [Streptomyces sp. NPDC047097]|uniref:hypothetical protein n=1 Tax=Streptomyces sp. NPDC047097 TaxID=3155260 RepID=UPI003410C0EC